MLISFIIDSYHREQLNERKRNTQNESEQGNYEKWIVEAGGTNEASIDINQPAKKRKAQA